MCKKTGSPMIAERLLDVVDAAGVELTVHFRIGQPYEITADEWACAVALEGLHDHLADQHGVDSFQALMLAQRLGRQLLNGFIEDGGRILDGPKGNPIPLEISLDSGVLSTT